MESFALLHLFWLYFYKVFIRHLNMECFESAIPAKKSKEWFGTCEKSIEDKTVFLEFCSEILNHHLYMCFHFSGFSAVQLECSRWLRPEITFSSGRVLSQNDKRIAYSNYILSRVFIMHSSLSCATFEL